MQSIINKIKPYVMKAHTSHKKLIKAPLNMIISFAHVKLES